MRPCRAGAKQHHTRRSSQCAADYRDFRDHYSDTSGNEDAPYAPVSTRSRSEPGDHSPLQYYALSTFVAAVGTALVVFYIGTKFDALDDAKLGERQEKMVARIESKVDALDSKLNGKVDKMGQRNEALVARLDRLEQRSDGLSAKMDKMSQRNDAVVARLDRLDQRIDCLTPKSLVCSSAN